MTDLLCPWTGYRIQIGMIILESKAVYNFNVFSLLHIRNGIRMSECMQVKVRALYVKKIIEAGTFFIMVIGFWSFGRKHIINNDFGTKVAVNTDSMSLILRKHWFIILLKI